MGYWGSLDLPYDYDVPTVPVKNPILNCRRHCLPVLSRAGGGDLRFLASWNEQFNFKTEQVLNKRWV